MIIALLSFHTWFEIRSCGFKVLFSRISCAPNVILSQAAAIQCTSERLNSSLLVKQHKGSSKTKSSTSNSLFKLKYRPLRTCEFITQLMYLSIGQTISTSFLNLALQLFKCLAMRAVAMSHPENLNQVAHWQKIHLSKKNRQNSPDLWRVQHFTSSVKTKSSEKMPDCSRSDCKKKDLNKNLPTLWKLNLRRKCPIAADPTARRKT